MADRTERVILTAQISNFLSGMEKARQATEKTATEAQKLADKKQALNTLGLGLVAFGGAVSAGLLLAVSKMADFDAKMSQVQTLSHATGAEMDQLSNSALHMGQSIGFSASQVADAEIELVKAGVSVKDQLGGGLVGTLNLAAAGQLDVADATQIAASAMTQFALQGKDVPHVADLLAAGADKALGSVQDLGNGLKFVGPVAHSMGVSLDQTVGTLALFAQNGILGEQAGTGLRGVLLSLTSPSKLASDVMKEYGINLYDASGKFIGLAGTAEQLKKGLGGLTEAQRNQALGQIFGNQQITEATLLMQGGSKEVNKWTKAVNDQGFAADQAAGKMDNLKGDISKLQAAVDTGLIESAGGANSVLRGLTQNTTGLATVISNLPAPVLQVGFGITALVGGVTLLGGAALIAVPKIVEFRAAMSSLNLTSGALIGKIGKGGLILLGLTALAAGFANLGSTASLSVDKLAEVDNIADKLSKKNLNNLFKDAGIGVVDATAKTDKFKESLNNIASGSFFDTSGSSATRWIDGVTGGLTHLSDVYKTNQAQFEELGKKISEVAQTDLPAAQTQFKKLVDAAGGNKEAIRQLLTVMPDYKAQLIALAGDQGKTLTQQQLFNLAVGKGKDAQEITAQATAANEAQIKSMGGTAAAASTDVEGLTDSLKGLNSLTLDARDAERNFQQAVDDATQSVKDHGSSLDINTEQGRENQASLDKVASSARDAAAALFAQTGSQDQATGALQAGHDALIQQLGAYGIVGQAAEDYVANILGTPTSWNTLFTADTGGASKAIDGLQGQIDQFVTSLGVGARLMSQLGNGSYGQGLGVLKATGGYISGPGTGTSDSIAARLSNGEYVMTAAATARIGRDVLDRANYGRGFASGGYVAPTYIPASAPAAGSDSALGDGARITGTLDLGNGLTGFVDGRISSASGVRKTSLSTGKQKGAF